MLMGFPFCLTLFEQMIIQPATFIKCLIESGLLRFFGIDSVFEGFNHADIRPY